jgi:cytochrome c
VLSSVIRLRKVGSANQRGQALEVHQAGTGSQIFAKETKLKYTLLAATAALLLSVPAAQAAVDAEAAKALAKQNNCLKCHAVDKDKDGPAFKKIAEKYKGKADAETRLVTHLTSGEKAKFPDGHEEEHKIVKTSPPKDMDQIKNLVQWVLSQ